MKEISEITNKISEKVSKDEIYKYNLDSIIEEYL